ncbi:MAG: Rne/Rng family ribonuclease, partial [Planctomycetota bacterium]
MAGPETSEHNSMNENTPPMDAVDVPAPESLNEIAQAADESDGSTTTATSKKTTKKTAKKKVAKKTTKKAAKKTTAKKTTKKKVAKKTTKKAAKKTAKKKVSKKTSKKTATAAAADEPQSADEQPAAVDEVIATETERTPAEPEPVAAAEPEQPAEDEAAKAEKPSKKKAKKKAAKKAGRKPPSRSRSGDSPEPIEIEPGTAPAGDTDMLISYRPGEECRISLVEDRRLEDYFSEPTTRVSRVGNIFVGKVTNVESQIQAAFVDFGLEESGFLHVSDLHPRYFPGNDAEDTEKVGRKTPRRERPMIQQALKRGQEIIVQVLKEGVGTKGPTLTSYLSVPGRMLVMMPGMDKVGVSRKVEDEDDRKRMRKILDKLELPDGFGFILRTAGLEAGLEELQKDLEYLRRLWDDMERRRKRGGGPRLLYSESDLLLRTLRDQVGPNVKRIIVDHEGAIRRAAAFLKIAASSGSPSLELYEGAAPIFHAFGVEEQIARMHSPEVPLPSGGRLIIEQTEALVAIDVNSGKSRAARDAETNAFETNLEAVDEICRQLRLRDLGGLVINDLIDMRHASHRKAIEERFVERLRRDRARSTILPISRFGLLEMTRQRMRGSLEQQHFVECKRCEGRGLVRRSGSVAAEALRELTVLLDHDKNQKVELVVGPDDAGALLSERRAALARIERLSGKTVDVRISGTVAPGRFVTYAYDSNGSDVEIARLPKRAAKPKTLRWEYDDADESLDAAAELEAERAEADAAASEAEQIENEKLAAIEMPGDDDDDESGGRRKRRRRRGGR